MANANEAARNDPVIREDIKLKTLRNAERISALTDLASQMFGSLDFEKIDSRPDQFSDVHTAYWALIRALGHHKDLSSSAGNETWIGNMAAFSVPPEETTE